MSEKESNQKGSMYILAIVGIVAIVGVVVLILGKANTGNDISYDSDISGEAISRITGQPDLVISSVDSVIIPPNGTNPYIEIQYTIENKGTSAVPVGAYFHNYITLTYIDSDGVTVTTIPPTYGGSEYVIHNNPQVLLPGESVNLRFTPNIDIGTYDEIYAGIPYTFDIVLTTDAENDVTESNERNNEYSFTKTIDSVTWVRRP